jgi:hypothetical protein
MCKVGIPLIEAVIPRLRNDYEEQSYVERNPFDYQLAMESTSWQVCKQWDSARERTAFLRRSSMDMDGKNARNDGFSIFFMVC